jgi:hypothetical protein
MEDVVLSDNVFIPLSTELEDDRGRPSPSAMRCAFFILGLKLALRGLGFGPTLRWVRRRAERATVLQGPHEHLVGATCYAVQLAAALYPGRALCLEQSITLYYYLRRAGIHVKLRFGVEPFPFQAHAWVEYHGEPVNEFPERVRNFALLPELPL